MNIYLLKKWNKLTCIFKTEKQEYQTCHFSNERSFLNVYVVPLASIYIKIPLLESTSVTIHYSEIFFNTDPSLQKLSNCNFMWVSLLKRRACPIFNSTLLNPNMIKIVEDNVIFLELVKYLILIISPKFQK